MPGKTQNAYKTLEIETTRLVSELKGRKVQAVVKGKNGLVNIILADGLVQSSLPIDEIQHALKSTGLLNSQ